MFRSISQFVSFVDIVNILGCGHGGGIICESLIRLKAKWSKNSKNK